MKEIIYLSGYTKRGNKGFNQITLNHDEKVLEDFQPVFAQDAATYFEFSDNEQLLYTLATDENNRGGIAAFKQEEPGQFTKVNFAGDFDNVGAHISVDNKHNKVYTSNYHLGLLDVYNIAKDGSVSHFQSIHHEGSGPHKNQDKAHVHFAKKSIKDDNILVCDLGTDGVYVYQVQEDGNLKEINRHNLEAGSGARHLIEHPNQPYLYVLGELTSTIDVFSYEPETGAMASIYRVNMLPEDWTDFNSGAAIRISNDGRFLYASNRGHNSIVVFKVSEDGSKLDFVQRIPCEGDFPRDFNFNKDEKFLIVAHQNSDNLTLFERNTESGELTLLQKDVHAPEIVCVSPIK